MTFVSKIGKEFGKFSDLARIVFLIKVHTDRIISSPTGSLGRHLFYSDFIPLPL